jgi:hypothetical protein
MHLRTAHRWTTTHRGGHKARKLHIENLAQAFLDSKKFRNFPTNNPLYGSSRGEHMPV